jgi:hypothetical protein
MRHFSKNGPLCLSTPGNNRKAMDWIMVYLLSWYSFLMRISERKWSHGGSRSGKNTEHPIQPELFEKKNMLLKD